LILVPGLLCDDAVWEQQAAALKADVDVRIADNGDHDSLAAMAESIIAQAPPRFAIAGHSMGGRIALEVMRRVPQRIDGFALLDSGYQALAPGEAGEREAAGRHRLVEKAREHGMRAMGVLWMQGMIYPQRLADPALVSAILAMIERRTPDFYAAQTHALLNRQDATSLLAGISCPTLLLCGEQDNWSPLERHRTMAAAIPQSTLSIIPECGHMSTMERPEAVSAALRAWLKTIDGYSRDAAA
jgi:pimeloyl-ACP methyl ester carboxylesterase